jgi:hypothetical protein
VFTKALHFSLYSARWIRFSSATTFCFFKSQQLCTFGFRKKTLIFIFGIYSKILEFIFCRNFDKAWSNETVHLRAKQILVATKESQFSESRFLEISYRPNGYAVVANVVPVLGTEFRRIAYVCVHMCLRRYYTCSNPFIYLLFRLKIEVSVWFLDSVTYLYSLLSFYCYTTLYTDTLDNAMCVLRINSVCIQYCVSNSMFQVVVIARV